ncbi:MAG: phytoene desaturase family protein [Aggregatilineales bacterium]
MVKNVIVIGAGIGGLSAAIRLSIAGYNVTIYEKNAQVGGKMGQISADGFRWDTGPSVITMRHVLEELFNAAGRDMRDYFTLIPVDPLTRYFYPDGTIIDASRELSTMLEQIEALNEHDVEGYLAYLAYAARIHRVTGPVFIYDQPPTPASFAKVPVRDWLKADPFRTMQGAIKSFVKSPQMRQLLGRFATYVGGSPYDAPATLNVIAHVELNGGVWYPQGGIYTIAEGMARLAQELGVSICTSCGVQQIDMQEGNASGIILENGENIPADIVVANVDVTTAYKHLLPQTPQVQKRLKKLQSYEASCSGLIFLLGVEGTHPQLAHHNIFFSADYQAEFNAIFKQNRVPDDPTIYVAITSKADPDHAPDGYENWFVLVNAPPLTENFVWTEDKIAAYRPIILEKLARSGIDIREKIRVERVFTPNNLQTMTGAWQGALYGPSPNSKWTAFRRPHNRCADVRGVYFVGGTTHPGGGVPMVTLSGKVAAEMIIADDR